MASFSRIFQPVVWWQVDYILLCASWKSQCFFTEIVTPDMEFSSWDSAKTSFVNLMKFLIHHCCIMALHLMEKLISKQMRSGNEILLIEFTSLNHGSHHLESVGLTSGGRSFALSVLEPVR